MADEPRNARISDSPAHFELHAGIEVETRFVSISMLPEWSRSSVTSNQEARYAFAFRDYSRRMYVDTRGVVGRVLVARSSPKFRDFTVCEVEATS